MNHFYIYMMYNEKNELLYVGQTKNLKRRFQGHFTKATLEVDTWKKDVSYIDTFECKTEYDMRIIEIYLIGTLKPKYNKEFVFNDDVSLKIKFDKFNCKRYLIHEKFISNLKDEILIANDLDDILFDNTVKNKIKNNVIVYEGKMNTNYFKKNLRKNELSHLWFDNQATDEQIKQVCCNLENYFKNKIVSKSENILVIVYDEFVLDKLKKYNLKGCIKGIRFLNQYLDKSFDNRNNIAYLINDFTYGYDDIKNIAYLITLLNYEIDNSDKKVNLYLPSKRMRELFFKWLNE
ncbi:MAG: nucleotide excision repair endonuclease [Bacilli bacterium]|nr:nucleotide excision repair endonuclease [Bacilli bacterium]